VATTGIILAGGKALRFGREKNLIVIDDQILINRTCSAIKSVCEEIIIVTNRDQLEELSKLNIQARLVTDIFPNKAAMGGLYTGLVNSSNEYSLAVASDMPFLNIDLLSYIVEAANGFDVAVPKIGSFIEPLHAVYSKNCVIELQRLLKANTLSLYRLLNAVKTRYVSQEEIDRFDPEHLSIFNINTSADLAKAEEILKSGLIKTYHDKR
jgi:molybdopterin-guanine dinucleotide biosynthesis protein A